MSSVTEEFGSLVFGDTTMKEKLPKETYRAMQRTIKNGKHLDLEVANVVANAMKDWAIEKGATHFTHWFQPMTGITAEKHDSFISPTDDGKRHNGVLRQRAGARRARRILLPLRRSPRHIRGKRLYRVGPIVLCFHQRARRLCIPTAFCSYGGEALDKKTPLLRSMERINKQALRVLRLFGNDDVTSVKTTVGAGAGIFPYSTEELFDKRKDLIYTGRTLFGAQAAEGSGAGRPLFRRRSKPACCGIHEAI